MKTLGSLGYFTLAIFLGALSIIPYSLYALSASPTDLDSTNYYALAIAIIIDIAGLAALVRSILIMREGKETK